MKSLTSFFGESGLGGGASRNGHRDDDGHHEQIVQPHDDGGWWWRVMSGRRSEHNLQVAGGHLLHEDATGPARVM